MNVSITIDSVTISITDKGYDRFRARMTCLVESVPESMRELVSADAEKRLAEYFSAKSNAGKTLFTDQDVDVAFSELGFGKANDGKAKDGKGGIEANEAKGEQKTDYSAGGFEKESQKDDNNEDAPNSSVENSAGNGNKPSFWRSTSQVVIGGVCGGISEKYDIDVVWIRLAFVVITLFFFQPWVLVGYLILWIVLPTNSSCGDVVLNGAGNTSERGGCIRCCFVALVIGLVLLAIVCFFVPIWLLKMLAFIALPA